MGAIRNCLTLIGKSWKTHPEIFLKFSFSGSSHRPFYWKTHPVFFRNLNSGASHRPFYWKTHPLKIMGTYSVFLILGRHTGRFTGKLIHSNFEYITPRGIILFCSSQIQIQLLVNLIQFLLTVENS